MKVLLTTIPSDSHTWNLVFLELFIEELGHKVMNLGACVPTDLLLEKANAHRPDIIVVSSINGHANIEGVALAKAIKSCDRLRDTHLIIGGKLGVKGKADVGYIKKLTSAGFHAVYSGDDSMDDFSEYIKQIDRFMKQRTGLVA